MTSQETTTAPEIETIEGYYEQFNLYDQNGDMLFDAEDLSTQAKHRVEKLMIEDDQGVKGDKSFSEYNFHFKGYNYISFKDDTRLLFKESWEAFFYIALAIPIFVGDYYGLNGGMFVNGKWVSILVLLYGLSQLRFSLSIPSDFIFVTDEDIEVNEGIYEQVKKQVSTRMELCVKLINFIELQNFFKEILL